MQENCTSGLPSGDWKREGILAVRQPVCAPVVDSTPTLPTWINVLVSPVFFKQHSATAALYQGLGDQQ